MTRLWTPPRKPEHPEPPRGLHRALIQLGLRQRELDAQHPSAAATPKRPRASQEVRRRRRAVKTARKANRK